MIRVVLTDFDGTLVNKDILDVACGIVGKEEESRRINEEFHLGKRPGLPTIITRINYLKEIKIGQIKEKLDQGSFLNKGAKELVNYLLKNRYITVLYSGNIVPLLAYYQQLLGFNYVVGTRPKMEGETILGISRKDFPKTYKDQDFKVYHIERFLRKININPKEVLAVGNSPSDIPVFNLVGYAVVVNPSGGVEKYADYVIHQLDEVIPLLEKIGSNPPRSKRQFGDFQPLPGASL